MVQFWAGLLIYIFAGPFCRMIVLCYSVHQLDSLGWGKTRKIVEDVPNGEKSTIGIESSELPTPKPDQLERAEPRRNAEKEEASMGLNSA